jgi:hypothetical protein
MKYKITTQGYQFGSRPVTNTYDFATPEELEKHKESLGMSDKRILSCVLVEAGEK